MLCESGRIDVVYHCNWSLLSCKHYSVFQPGGFFMQSCAQTDSVHFILSLCCCYCTALFYWWQAFAFVCWGELDAHTLISQLICISQPTEYLFKQRCMTLSHGFGRLNCAMRSAPHHKGASFFNEHVNTLCPARMLAVKSLNNFGEPLYRNARPGIWQDWDNYCLAS